MKAVFDLDDLCDIWDPRKKLEQWHADNPGGKVTLFTIPGRSSDALIDHYAAQPWVELAMHGWWHTRGECLWWTQEHTERLMAAWEDRGLAKVFKAPAWLLNEDVYKAAASRGWVVADHNRNRANASGNLYVYNSTRNGIHGAHGHTHDVSGNGIDEAYQRFVFKPDTEFLFVSEAAS
jgi:hypothetical protein